MHDQWTDGMNVGALIAAAIPSALLGLAAWWIKKAFDKIETERREQEKAREEFDIILIESINSAVALGEATANALKNGHANGDTEAALEYARDVKHKQKEFLTRKGVEQILK